MQDKQSCGDNLGHRGVWKRKEGRVEGGSGSSCQHRTGSLSGFLGFEGMMDGLSVFLLVCNPSLFFWGFQQLIHLCAFLACLLAFLDSPVINTEPSSAIAPYRVRQ